MIFVAGLFAVGESYHVEDILAIGTSRQEAVDLVMDAWHHAADRYNMDRDSAHEEDVAVWAGEVGQAFVNRERTQ